MSRRALINPAATSNTTAVTAGSTRTSGWGFPNDCISSAHPSGVSQRIQP